MPWKVVPVSDCRLTLCLMVRSLGHSVSSAARAFNVSRKTAYKWLDRFDLDPSRSLADRSTRPQSSPRRTGSQLQSRALDLRDRYGWGPRKIRAVLASDFPSVPSIRTFANILKRNDRIRPATPPAEIQRFERAMPNELWQVDFKGPLEIERRRVVPFSVLDDHSRFLLALKPCTDQTMSTAWKILWDLFGDVGLPERLLCDNAFGNSGPPSPGISWFESQLARLNISISHGRPYHPQTQGKVERLHGTLERELWPYARRDSLANFDADCQNWRLHVYNTLRPHEALGDRPPLTRWRPSLRVRPATLPTVEYPTGSVLRKVGSSGEIYWNSFTILVGSGIAGHYVRVEDRDHEVALFFCSKCIRTIVKTGLPHEQWTHSKDEVRS